MNATAGGVANQSTSASGGLGFAGGAAPTGTGGNNGRGGGGGGAGQVGAAGNSGSTGGYGYRSLITSSCYGGGGSGGVGNEIPAPGTPSCGGGAGGKTNAGVGTAGTANTGGGGGGGGSIAGAGANGGAGGSGVVIVRYPTEECSATSTSGAYTTVTITRNCAWTAPADVTSVELLLVAGGGGGGAISGGGGGAGGVVAREGAGTPVTVKPGTTYQAVVGDGGAGASPVSASGKPGGNTTFLGLTALGGGAGGWVGAVGSNGGSGGGGGGSGGVKNGGSATQPTSASAGRGTAGGASGGSGGGAGMGGGGGGARGAGSSATARSGGGLGYTSQINGICYAGGGGGGIGDGVAGDPGTASCGGGEGSKGHTTPGSSATPNSGGGGGGGGSVNGAGAPGGHGGSGIIVLRYPPRPCSTSTTSGFTTTVVVTADCDWTAPDDVARVQVLMVGGGGGGGHTAGGGGGGGGVVAREGIDKALPVTPGTTYPIVIGGGGLGGAPGRGSRGGDTTFNGLVAVGGGGGGGVGEAGSSGGSGGGGGMNGSGGAASQGASASGGLGNSGGSAPTGTGGGNGRGGGGGGAGAAGVAGASGGTGGAGYTSLLSGQCYGGGGGGGVGNTIASAGTATCGGGAGGKGGTKGGADGLVNTGGGGGGGGSMAGAGASGGTGGSGIVVLRYTIRDCVPSETIYDDAHTVEVFKTTGGCLWTPPDRVTGVEYLLVGGGGGGGGGVNGVNWGAGAAGGTVRTGDLPVTPGASIKVNVAAGGQGAGATGGTSALGDIAAPGGAGTTTPRIGGRNADYSGWAGPFTSTSSGGGAGAGASATSSVGGAGKQSSITGTATFYGGGGGGFNGSTPMNGGSGGGGKGFTAGTNGLGGGGGGNGFGKSANGGSGVVILRYTRECDATVTYSGQYTVYTITEVGTCEWTAPSGTTKAEYLVVGGGGGGAGRDVAGGGGGGGVRTNVGSPISVVAGTAYGVRVGDGGAGSTDASGANGSNGQPSWAFGIESAGGGGGGYYTNRGSAGGSGGGSGQNFTTYGGAGNAPYTTPSQGSYGGPGVGGRGGGGGGAGAQGASGASGIGGAGTLNSITGTSLAYGGGGGGSAHRGATDGAAPSGAGGVGGGGAGGAQNQNGTAGTDGLGGGGGASRKLGGVGGSGGSGVVIIRHQTATSLQVQTQPVGGAAGSTLSVTPVLRLLDGSGNVAADDSVTVVTATVNNNGVLTNATATAQGGIIRFPNLTLGNRTGTNYTLTFTANTPIPLKATATATQVTHAAASKLAFTTKPPATTVAGVPFSPQLAVTVQDQYGNTVTTGANSTAPVTLSIQSGGGALSGTTTENALAGVATFSGISDDTAATGKVMKAAASGLADDTAVYAITPAAVSSVRSQVLASPTSVQAGGATRSAITVTLRDAFGNQMLAGGANVSVTSTAGIVGTVIDNGNGTYSTTLTPPTTTGTATVRAYVGQSQLASVATVTFTPGSPHDITVASGNWQDDTVGAAVSGPIRVKVTDVNRNAVPGASVTFTVRSGSGQVGGGSVVTTDDSGIATLPAGSWTLGPAAGTQTLSATLTGSSTSTVVSAVAVAGAVTKFTVTRGGGSAPLSDDSLTAGVAQSIRITALDASGNANSEWGGQVTLTSTAFAGTITATISSGGFVDTNFTPTIAGSARTITAESSGISPSTAASGFTVVAGSLEAFDIAVPTSPVTAGTSASVTVTAKDGDGNTIPTWAGQVALTSNAFAGTVNATVSAGGSGSVTTTVTPTIAGTLRTITAVGGGISSTSDDSFAVVAGTPGKLVLSRQPVAAVNGQVLATQPILRIQDNYGNLTASDDTVVAAASTGAAVGGNTEVAAQAGIATFTGLTMSGIVGTDYTLTFSVSSRQGVTPVTSQTMRVTGAGQSTSLLLQVAPPTTSPSGALFATAPQVAVTDAGGNVAAADNSTQVTATLSDPSGSFVGTVTQVVTNGVARFTNLGVSGTAGIAYTVSFEAQGLASASSSVQVTVGAPAQLGLLAQPTATIPYGTQVVDDTGNPLQVRVLDSGGNLVTSAGVSLVAARDGDPSAYLKSSTATVSSGVATFTGLSLYGPTASYKLTFSASGVTSVTTQPFALGKGAQTITFAAPASVALGGPDSQMTATASSGLPVSFRLPAGASDDTCVVTSSGFVRAKAVGTCVIEAFQVGDALYDAAPDVQQSLTITPGLPGAPYITAVSGSAGAVTARYTAPSFTGGADITNYQAFALDQADKVIASNTNCGIAALVCTITGLVDGSSYTIKVQAKNSVGPGSLSAGRAGAPNTNSLAVGSLDAGVVNPTTVRLSWTKPVLQDDTFVSYDVYDDSGAGWTLVATLTGIDSTEAFVGGLTPGVAYNFRVTTTVTNASSVTLTGYAEIRETPAGVPSAPVSLTAAYAGDDSLTLSWSPPQDDGGATLDDTYTVHRVGSSVDDTQVCGTQQNRYCTYASLTPGATYTFSVSASNRIGLGAPASISYTMPSANASLSSLAVFNGATLIRDDTATSWSTAVGYATQEVTVKPTAEASAASITVNGQSVTSGSSTGVGLMPGGATTIKVVVIPPNGDRALKQTYTITVSRAGPPTKLAAAPTSLSGFASGATLAPMTVNVTDDTGTVATDTSASVTVRASGGTLGGTTTVSAAAGSAAFNDLVFAGRVGTTYTLTFTSPGLAPTTVAVTPSSPGAASQLVYTTFPPVSATAGVAWTPSPVFEIQDAAGNRVTGDNTTKVTLSLANATLVDDTEVTAQNGVATFTNVRIGTIQSGSAGALTVANSSALTAPPAQIVGFAPGVPTTLEVARDASGEVVSGTDTVLTATVKDAQGNVATNATGSVTFSTVGGSGDDTGTVVGLGAVPLVNGVANITVSGATLGPVALKATYASLSTALPTFSVVPGPPSALILTGSAADLPAGSTRTVSVRVVDAVGNTVPTAGTVQVVQSSGAGKLSGVDPITLVDGRGDDTVTGLTPGPVALTASLGSLTSNPVGFNVVTGVPVTLQLSGAAGILEAGDDTLATATLLDGNGNVVMEPSYNVVFALSPADDSIVSQGQQLPQTVRSVDGVASISLTGRYTGSIGVTASVSALALSSTTQTLTVVPGPVAAISLPAPSASSDLGAGTSRTFTATLTDVAGNVVTGDDTVTFTQVSGSGTVTGLGQMCGDSSPGLPCQEVQSSGGQAQVTLTGDQIGSVALEATVSRGGSTYASQTVVFDIVTGPAAQLILTAAESGTMASGSSREFTATLKDARGNVVTGQQALVNFRKVADSGAGTISGSTSAAATAGVATVTKTGVVAGTLILEASATINNSVVLDDTVALSVVPGEPATLAIVRQPAGLGDNSPLTTQPVIRIQDAAGNDPAVAGIEVTAELREADGTPITDDTALFDDTAITDASGIATFGNLTANVDPGSYKIRFTSPGLSGVTSQVLELQRYSQTITVSLIADRTYGQAPFPLDDTTAMASSGLKVTLTSSTPSVCSVASDVRWVVSILSAGTCTLEATQAGNARYAPAADKTITFAIAKADQAPLRIATDDSTVLGVPLVLGAVGGSGSGATSITAAPAGDCIVTSTGGNSLLTITRAGSAVCTITATKSGNANYLNATPVTKSVSVERAPQTLAFTSVKPLLPVSGGSYSVSVSSTSSTTGQATGLTPSLGVTGSCTVSGTEVTFTAAGTCTITAQQGGSSDYLPATDVVQAIEVGLLNQSISFTQPANVAFGDPTSTLTATSSAGLPVSFSSSTAAVCTVDDSSGVVSALTPGDCTITATAPGDTRYAAASPVARSFTILAGLPTEPYVTSVSAGDRSITVGFTAPGFTGGLPVTGYRVTAYPLDGSSPITTSACPADQEPLSCTVTGLDNDKQYRVTVVAITGAGSGPATDLTPLDPASADPSPAPFAVTAPTAVRDDSIVEIRWAPLTGDQLAGGTFDSYVLQYRSGDEPFTDGPIRYVQSDNRAVISNLDPTKQYEFRLVALTSTNPERSPLNTAVVAEYPPVAPDPVRDITVTPMAPGDRARVTWSAPLSDGGLPISGYSVTITPPPSDGSSGTCSPSPVTLLQCTFTGLDRGTEYAVTVTAFNGAGDSAGGGTQTTLPTQPERPRRVTAEATTVSSEPGFEVTWRDPSSDGGAAITGYTATAVLRSAIADDTASVSARAALDDTTFTCSSDATSCFMPAPGSIYDYTFTVTAGNLAGVSEPSEPFAPVKPNPGPGPNPNPGPGPTPGPDTEPSAPRLVRAQAGAASATITWAPPASPGSGPVTGYRVISSPGDLQCQVKAPALRCSIKGLETTTSYTFRVSARNSVGWGPWSEPSNSITPRDEVAKPSKPRQVKAVDLGDGRVRVTWRPPTSEGGSAVTGYRIGQRLMGTKRVMWKRTDAYAREIVLKGLKPGGLYYIRVRAANDAGVGKGVMVRIRLTR